MVTSTFTNHVASRSRVPAGLGLGQHFGKSNLFLNVLENFIYSWKTELVRSAQVYLEWNVKVQKNSVSLDLWWSQQIGLTDVVK